MGGGASKVSQAYVLHTVDDELGGRASTPPKVKKGLSSKNFGALDETKLASPRVIGKEGGGSGKVVLDTASPAQSISVPSRKLGRSISQLAADGGGGSSAVRGKFAVSARHGWLAKTMPGAGCPINNMSQFDEKLGRIIGRGLMGTVRVAKLKDREMYMALKAVRKDYIVKHKDQNHIENERRVMLTLQSPFCIRLFGTFQDGPNVYFAMELAVGGELFRRLSKGDKDGLPAQECRFYMHEIFSALDHLQSLGYVYRDLKPENVMLDEEGHCKLVDFGFSTRPDENGIIRTLCGTPAYLSPEQLNGKFTNGYSKCCDWWSLGIICYELMTGKTPFCKSAKESNYEIYLRILKTKIAFPSRWKDAQAKELVQSLCHANMDKRLVDPDVIRNNPYFTIPWESVVDLKLVPPFVPRIKDPKDREHYFRRYGEDTREQTDTEGRLELEGF